MLKDVDSLRLSLNKKMGGMKFAGFAKLISD